MAQTLTGKKIVVTGGSRGIGADVVRNLAAQGPAAIVIGYASRKSSADALIEEIQQKHGNGIALTSVGGAIVDQASAQAFAKDALQALEGELDILVNVAGIMKMHPLSSITQAEYESHLQANVAAPLFLTQSLSPHMRAEGRIIFFSTSLTTHPVSITPGYLPYLLSKGAVEQMTRVLARDPSLSGPDRRITVNAISPGPIGTALFFEGKSQELLDRIAGAHPSNRLGQPNEVASAVAFLVSPAASWVSGQNLPVNGGWSV